jgi:ribonuclease G
VLPLLDHYTGERPLFDLHGVEDEIQKALARRVDLKSGGYLIIDQTEAMTTVDVNTGGFVGVRNFDDTIFKTNLEAAHHRPPAAPAQPRRHHHCRLHRHGKRGAQESAVLTEFNKALARDHTRLTVNGFTALGLVEMTRKRTRESLAHVLCEPCPTCGGRGEVKTARTVATKSCANCCAKRASSTPANTACWPARRWSTSFLDEESQALAMLSDFIGKSVSCNPNPAIRPSNTTSF